PGLSAARTPGRFNFAVGFALAIMAAYGAQSIARRITPPFIRGLILVVIGGLIAFEYQFWFPVPTVAADIPAPIAALADRDDIRAVFDVPFDHPLVDKEGLYLQTAHHQPMIGGHVTRQTPLSPAKGWLLQTFDPALLDLLGADVMILHREWDDAEGVLETRLRDQFGAPTYEDERYALFELPPYTGDAPGFTAISRVPETLTDSASLYFYLPAPGEVILTGQLSGDGVSARLTLDGDRLVTWTVSGRQGWNLPVQVRAPGWHTLTLALDPPCPTPTDPALVCRALSIHHIDLTDYRPVRSP
ncbi:MAG: hypothetical protein IAE80_00440, partial [Anaerolinea sp.]|nr:hypothetical protein [Anaerolinea sp.]